MTTHHPVERHVVSVEAPFTKGKRIAPAGFLASYSSQTRDAYALDLRMFTAWVPAAQPAPVPGPAGGHRVFRPDMKSRERARATMLN